MDGGKSRCVAGVLVLTMAAVPFLLVFDGVWQARREKYILGWARLQYQFLAIDLLDNETGA